MPQARARTQRRRPVPTIAGACHPWLSCFSASFGPIRGARVPRRSTRTYATPSQFEFLIRAREQLYRIEGEPGDKHAEGRPMPIEARIRQPDQEIPAAVGCIWRLRISIEEPYDSSERAENEPGDEVGAFPAKRVQ